jgi:hypothetical protein
LGGSKILGVKKKPAFPGKLAVGKNPWSDILKINNL